MWVSPFELLALYLGTVPLVQSFFLALAPEATASVNLLARHLLNPLDLPKRLDIVEERTNGLEHLLTPFRRHAECLALYREPLSAVKSFSSPDSSYRLHAGPLRLQSSVAPIHHK